MRKAHAEHNEKACDFLYNNGNFHDWVVTTAFNPQYTLPGIKYFH